VNFICVKYGIVCAIKGVTAGVLVNFIYVKYGIAASKSPEKCRPAFWGWSALAAHAGCKGY
jgi:hypothetical protein